MSEPPDLDLRDPDADDGMGLEPIDRGSDSPGPVGLAVGALALIALLGGGAYFYLHRGAVPTPASPTPAPQPIASPAPSPTPLDVRPLDESDAMIRDLAKALSNDARFAEWLHQSDLVRRFVAAVVHVAAGESPRTPLDFLAPKGKFLVQKKVSQTLIDRRSYARYDAVAEVIASLDADASARVLGQIQSLIDTAYAEAGQPDERFATSLQKAVQMLLDTPIPDGDVAVREVKKPTGTVYEFVDPKLEALTPAQKHLIRLGPDNARKVKAKIRELANALHIPLS